MTTSTTHVAPHSAMAFAKINTLMDPKDSAREASTPSQNGTSASDVLLGTPGSSSKSSTPSPSTGTPPQVFAWASRKVAPLPTASPSTVVIGAIQRAQLQLPNNRLPPLDTGKALAIEEAGETLPPLSQRQKAINPGRFAYMDVMDLNSQEQQEVLRAIQRQETRQHRLAAVAAKSEKDSRFWMVIALGAVILITFIVVMALFGANVIRSQ